MNAAAKIIEMAEEGVISWETIAREALAQMPCDECQSVAEALDIEVDEDEFEY